MDMAGYADEVQIFLVETLFERLRGVLPNGKKLVNSTIDIEVTNNPGLEVHHSIALTPGIKNAWSFYIPLCREGTVLFFYYKEITRVQTFCIHFSSCLLIQAKCIMGTYASSKGNISLHGTLISKKLILIRGVNKWITGNGRHVF